jgi:hypothetical protein
MGWEVLGPRLVADLVDLGNLFAATVRVVNVSVHVAVAILLVGVLSC